MVLVLKSTPKKMLKGSTEDNDLTQCWYVVFLILVVCKTKENAGLAHCWVTYDEELGEVVVVIEFWEI